MTIMQALRIGLRQVNQTRRMVLLAWFINIVLALVLAFPLLSQLDAYVRGTVMEERLLEQIDSNWFQTFKNDQDAHDAVRSFDFTIFGYAPFLAHYEAYLAGTFVKNTGIFLFDLFFGWQVSLEYLNPLVILAFLYLLISTFLSGGFIGMYAKSYALSFQEFLIEGARYFGRFFRLSLLSLIVYVLLFEIVFDWWTGKIPLWTANARSEMTVFVHYMVKNGVTLFVLGFVTLCFDYAKIRIVVDDRMSALFASWAGLRFVLSRFLSVAGLYIILSVAGLFLIVVYAVLEGAMHASGYWTILLVFLIQQVYLFCRLLLKAAFYASQTQLYQGFEDADRRLLATRSPLPM